MNHVSCYVIPRVVVPAESERSDVGGISTISEYLLTTRNLKPSSQHCEPYRARFGYSFCYLQSPREPATDHGHITGDRQHSTASTCARDTASSLMVHQSPEDRRLLYDIFDDIP